MGINELQLSPELISLLYPESLVTTNRPDPREKPSRSEISTEKNKSPYPYLGKNLKAICFLVSSPQDIFIGDEQRLFLEKILAACKISLDDIALINTKNHLIDLEELKTQFHPQILFLWGARPAISGLELDLPDLTVTIQESLRIIPVLQAERMSRDDAEGRELKRSLWAILKKLFNL